MSDAKQELLRSAWLDGKTGALPAREQAKAWARHPVWRRARTTMSSRSAGRSGAAGARGHTPPLCFYNFKSQTGCVSSATLFCGNQVSAFVPPLHLTQFFAGPPRVRLLSAPSPPQFFEGPSPVRPSFLRVRQCMIRHRLKSQL